MSPPESWTESFPIVLHRTPSSQWEDLKATSVDLVYGEPLRLPGEFMIPIIKNIPRTPIIYYLDSEYLLTNCALYQHLVEPVLELSYSWTSKTVYMCPYNHMKKRGTYCAAHIILGHVRYLLELANKIWKLRIRGKPVSHHQSRQTSESLSEDLGFIISRSCRLTQQFRRWTQQLKFGSQTNSTGFSRLSQLHNSFRLKSSIPGFLFVRDIHFAVRVVSYAVLSVLTKGGGL